MNVLIVLGVFISMEGATWLIHRYIMHGFLWILHRDHHDHSHDGKLERNDWFFFIFASPAIALLYIGVKQDFNYWFYIGLGISLYGMAYFFVHDIFIHQRAKVFTKTKIPISLRSGVHINSITSTWEKKMESVLAFYGFPLNILKCISIKNDALYLHTD